MAVTHDFVVDEGTTFRRIVRWKQSDGAVPPVLTPVDLDGYTALLEAWVRDVGEPVVHLTETDGLVIRPDLGEIEIVLASGLTTGLASPLRYVLEAISPDGDVWRLMEGKIKVDLRKK